MVYVGADFPDTTPDAQRVYTLDFVNMIAILYTELVTVTGTPTPGDTVFLTLANPTLQKLSETISYVVLSSDTLASISAGLASAINGDDILNDAGITATTSGPAFSVSWPGATAGQAGPITTVITAFVSPASPGGTTTEIISVTPGPAAGETIQSATGFTTVWQGTPDPTNRVLQPPYITGSKVAVLAGNFVAGNKYRIEVIATTTQQPAVPLHSHIMCNLPQ